MNSKDLVNTDEFPVPSPRSRGVKTKAKARKDKMGLEAAAIAYVQMENAEYKYPPGARKQSGDHPVYYNGINKRELMRRAGYAPGSLDHFDEYVAPQDSFWELVELHRLRRTDPMFMREQENMLWQALGGEALRNLYERLYYSPHSLSTEQHIKIVKLILDAGITLQKLGGDKPNKTNELLGDMSPEDKKKAMSGYKEKLIKDLKEVEAIELAEKGARQ